VLLGLENTNPLQYRQTFREVMKLPRSERRAAFANPDVRGRILSEVDEWPATTSTIMKNIFNWSYAFTHPGDFEPGPDHKLSVIAEREGRTVNEVAYDLMLRDGFVQAPVLNYGEGDLEVARSLFTSPHCVLGASDAGAHCLTVCDGALPTFMLSHWSRDRQRGDRLPVEQVVHMLTAKPAESYGMTDRGRIAQGLAADLNLIDLDAIQLEAPEVAYDLPSGAPRLVQRASGYAATMVGGTVTRSNDEDTGERPGRLLRRRLH